MKVLHTSDWHAGKVLKGVHRLDEQRAVLGGMVELAREEQVDLVLVAGDLFESAVPAPDAQTLVWASLLAFRDTGAAVVVIAGNHDNAMQLEALRPLAAAAGITVLGRVRRPDVGSVRRIGSLAPDPTAPGRRSRLVLRIAHPGRLRRGRRGQARAVGRRRRGSTSEGRGGATSWCASASDH